MTDLPDIIVLPAWQPIDTAPKDGTWVLVLENRKTPVIASWATFYSPFYRGDVSGWWTGSDPGRCSVIVPDKATHWMPLPEPPA